MTAGVAEPTEALATLRRRLAALPGRHPQREILLSSTSEDTCRFEAAHRSRCRARRPALGRAVRPSEAEERPAPAPDGGNRRPHDGVRVRRPTRPPARLHRMGSQEQRRRGCRAEEVMTDAAATRLAAKLKTPLQIGQHLVRAFEAAFEIGAKPVDENVVEAVLSLRIDDLEPRLTRSGYDVRKSGRAVRCRTSRNPPPAARRPRSGTLPRIDGRDARGGAADLIGWHHAPMTVYCASVSSSVRCVSTSVRRTPASVSDNVRRERPSIARRAVHHCAPLQLSQP
jgi:hypothetical protein